MTSLRFKRILKKLWLLSILGREDRRIKKVYEEKPPYNYYKEKETMVKKEIFIKLSSENSAIPLLNSSHWFLHTNEGKFWSHSWHYKGYPVGFQPIIFFTTEKGVVKYLLSLDNSNYPTLDAARMAALTFIRKKLKSQIENVGGIVSFLD